MTAPLEDIKAYHYELPEKLIASQPAENRADARLMVIDRKKDRIEHHSIRDLPQFLNAGDCLVLNNTRVVPAKLIGQRTATGGRWEGLFLKANENNCWFLVGQTRGKIQPGEQITIFPVHDADSDEALKLTLISRDENNIWLAEPEVNEHYVTLLEKFGTVPLPPYIKRAIANSEDKERYQTVYSSVPGAVAAPTAGLHFTPELLDQCLEKNVDKAYVTLHVGMGTFKPVTVSRLDDHIMHSEWGSLPEETAEKIQATKENQGRIVAVGTTSVRTLESASTNNKLKAWSGDTDLFIRPPYSFQSVDVLLTNFHLPQSTLLVLVCAFANHELIMKAYNEAIKNKYRFFSYGDAMLIL